MSDTNGFAIFSLAVAVDSKGGLMVPGAVWAVSVGVWTVTGAVWAVTAYMWAVTASMYAAKALCGLLHSLCMVCRRYVGWYWRCVGCCIL